MGGGRKKSKKKTKTKAQKMAVANKAKYGGTAKAAAANKASNKAKAKAKHTASQAAKGKTTTSSASKKTSGVGPVSSGKAYAKAVNSAKNQPTKKTSGVGPVADGAKYAQSLKISPPKTGGGDTLLAQGKINPFNIFQTQDALKEGEAAREGVRPEVKNPGLLDSILNRNSETQRMINELSSTNTDPGTLVAANNLAGIGTPKSTRFESATGSDAFAQSLGINTDVGGVNYGGLGSIREGGDYNPNANTSRAIFSGSNPDTSDRSRESFNFGPTVDRFGRGDDYARNINEFGMRFGDTSEARADAYNNTLTGRKNLFDNATSGSGPVASGDAYARGLEVSRFGSPMNAGKTILNTIPGVNFRLQNDKELADSVGRAPDLTGRGGGGGGARFAAAPLTPEEILLPEEVSPAAAGPTYQQTGLDNNRLMQIQQEAYRQAYNPMTVGGFNPMFRFFGRRQGPRRGAFRRAFTRTA